MRAGTKTMGRDLRQKVKGFMEQENMVHPGDIILAGVSGGADSVCLLLCLYSLSRELGISIEAVHIHHGIRGKEADRDALFVENLCENLGVTLTLYHEDVPAAAASWHISLEEAGRRIRYGCLEERRAQILQDHSKGDVKLALAHHMDDQAETVLMNLCRGTGIRGLGAMAPVQQNRIRPLLNLRRREIEEWLKEQGQNWMEDGTNQEEIYTRNRLRLSLIPAMEEKINAGTVEHLAAMARQARELDEYMEAEASRWMQENLQMNEAGSSLPEETGKLPAALRSRIFHRWIISVSGKSRDLTRRHLESMEGLFAGQAGRRIHLPWNLEAVKEQDRVFLRLRMEASVEEEMTTPDFTWRVFDRDPSKKIPEKECTKWFDYDKINGTLRFRRRKTGDSLELNGVGRKSVSRYMIDEKIPGRLRDRIPILADDSQVLWILGYRINGACQVTDETLRILEVTVRKEDSGDSGH